MAVKIFKNGKLVKVAGNYGNPIHSLLNKLYPVNCKFIFPSGSEDPASYIGGTWTKIASNVNLPLGSSASVVVNPNGNSVLLKKADGSHPFYNSTTTLRGIVKGGDMALNVFLNEQYNYNAIIDPLGTLVANASDYITVDIWQRVG